MPRTLLTILVALLGLTSALAQTAEERADAVKEFKRFFRKFKEVPQQVEAVRTLEGMESAAAADELVDLLDHKTPDVARAAYEVLITYEATETFAKHLAGLVEMKDAGAQARLIRVFGEAGLRDALPAMLEVAGGKRVGDEVRYAIAKSMIDLKAAEAGEQVVAPLLGDGNPLNIVTNSGSPEPVLLHFAVLGLTLEWIARFGGLGPGEQLVPEEIETRAAILALEALQPGRG
ncbi:MAG: hypothetical protein KC621_14270 [Myxococcales bacterium]|nr:hypothetical protein [Myxococcales bacterium]